MAESVDAAPAGMRRARPVSSPHFELRRIGRVESELVDLATAPKQGDEGGSDAWLVFEDDVTAGLRDLAVGDQVILLTWLHRARRDVLSVHPRDDATRPAQGVFSTRSASRPNPIGLHTVRIIAIDGSRVLVSDLETLNGTPILDLKLSLEPPGQR